MFLILKIVLVRPQSPSHIQGGGCWETERGRPAERLDQRRVGVGAGKPALKSARVFAAMEAMLVVRSVLLRPLRGSVSHINWDGAGGIFLSRLRLHLQFKDEIVMRVSRRGSEGAKKSRPIWR